METSVIVVLFEPFRKWLLITFMLYILLCLKFVV